MKECQQLRLEKPTFCFIRAGNSPCSNFDCLIQIRDKNTPSQGGKLAEAMHELLFHEECRMSTHSKDNEEFNRRLGRT